MGQGDPLDLGLIERVYDAALDDALIPELLEDIRRHFKSDGAGYVLHDPVAATGSLLAVAGFSRDIVHRYKELAPYNPRMQARAARMEVGSVAAGAELVADRDFTRTYFYNEMVRPLGVLPDLGTVVEREGDITGVLLLVRSPRTGPYNQRQHEALRVLSRHLHRAARLRRRMPAADHEQAPELSHPAVALVLLARDGRILFANRCAEVLLREERALKVDQGRIIPIDAGDAAGFVTRFREAAEAIQRSADMPICSQFLLRSGGDQPSHVVEFCPLRLPESALGGPVPAVAVFVQAIQMRRHGHVGIAALQRRYGLTPTEARLVMLLIHGRTVNEACESLGQSIHTTRSILKRIFAKTGTHRQGELVAMVLRNTENN